jgi:hypothetical protein
MRTIAASIRGLAGLVGFALLLASVTVLVQLAEWAR